MKPKVTATSCASEQLSVQSLLRDLPLEDEVQLVRHLESCSSCSERVESALTDASLRGTVRGRGADRPLSRYLDRIPAADAIHDADGRASVVTGPYTPVEFSFLSAPAEPGELGQLGEYRVLELVGAGGMGMVFRAEDPILKRTVALKVMRPEAASAARARDRFLREARTMAALEHDHIVAVHHVGEGRGVPFLVMPFLHGKSLHDFCRQVASLEQTTALKIGCQVASGLAAAHRAGLIHRDIKPGNIWIETAHDNRAKILDFGLARGGEEDVAITQHGAVLGTPAYMAPEQAAGGAVDARADLFSLGVVLYELTTGRRPFTGPNTMAVLSALANHHPTPPHELQPAVAPAASDLIMRLLEKDPAKRPTTADDVARELATILEGGTASRKRRSRKRRTAPVLLGTAAFTGVLAALYAFASPSPDPVFEQPATPAEQPPPAKVVDHQREAAEWVKQCGGWVMLAPKPGEQAKTYAAHEPLPEGHIEVVGIGFNKRPVRDDELELLRPLKRMSLLDLEGTGVGDAGVKHLAGCKGIWRIGLADTRVTDDSIDVLASLPGLRSVNFDRTGITPAGMARLRSRLPATSLSLPTLDGPEGDLRVANWLIDQRGSWTILMYSEIDKGPMHFLVGAASFAGANQKSMIQGKPWRMSAFAVGLDTKEIGQAQLQDMKALSHLAEVDVRRSQLNDEQVEKLRIALPGCAFVTKAGSLAPLSP